ncbi:MAG: efflux RND transporter periplasmic adaptor subunit [Cyclonatronaceae bacterium]
MPDNTLKLLSLFLFALVLTSCSGDSNGQKNDSRGEGIRIPTVEAVASMYGSLPLEERLTGSVRARNQIEIFPEITAQITQVLVNDGERVEQGQVLVRLRDTEIRERLNQAASGFQIAVAQVRQAENNVSQAESNLRRVRQLAERDLGSAAELERLEAGVESARASLQLAIAQREQASSIVSERRTALENTEIKAPISGIVGQRNAEVGQQVSPGTRLFEIGDTDLMRVRVVLTEQMLGYIETDQNVLITTPSLPDTLLRARVSRISPFLNPVSHTTHAEIDVDNRDGLLLPGMFVTVDILYGDSEKATLIPNSAIYRHPRDGTIGVYVAGSIGTELDFDDDERPEVYGPTPVEFRQINVVARGRMMSGVHGIDEDQWVITLGHNLITSRNATQAVIRATEWEHIIDLQQMQSRDLLNMIREKIARRNGSGGSGA